MARPSPVLPLARVFELSTWRNFSKDVLALFWWSAGAGIADAHGKVAVGRAGCDAHLSRIRELDGVADYSSVSY